ncbi:MAG: NAD(P)/FAD-dependent oxidoreductase [Solirubrobacterales bacterium]
MSDTLERAPIELTDADAAIVFAGWFERFAAALESADAAALGELFAADATWRDFMAFPWDFHHAIDRDEVVAKLIELAAIWEAGDLRVSERQAPLVMAGDVYAFFEFTTKDRDDWGFVRLRREGDRFLGATLQTQVESLSEFPESILENRPEGKVHGAVPGRTRWSADRRLESAFETEDPTVLVLGAGHNGLSVAARLGALGVPTLVIDREERVGDQWRKRYASLALHSIVYGDNLPFLPLPSNWTSHTPKDKWADWLESYARLMDLNVWTSTEFVNARYDEEGERWTVRVRRGDGSVRVLRPRHFVVAGGLFAAPKIPEIEGLDEFEGVWAHSDAFQDAADYGGKRALVVGAGVSGHEIAHDLWEQGAEVTILQRSSTYVLSYAAQHKFWNGLFTQDMALSPEHADQIQYAVPNVRTDPINKRLVKEAAEFDRDLLDRLEAVGFKLEWGPDGTGILGAHMSGYDSYQIDIGASHLVADGKIKLKQGVEPVATRGSTVVFSDGSEMPDVDLIVFATGYHQFWGHIKPALGSAAAKIDKAYGRAADGEYANTWRRSAQPGLWFATGFIRMCRFYSKFMALQIKAIEEEIEPYDPEKQRIGA